MNIAYFDIPTTNEEVAELCRWLDGSAPGWMLSSSHRERIVNVRSGNLTYPGAQGTKLRVRVSDKGAVLIKLFRDDAVELYAGPAASDDERIVGCELAEYNGPWEEFSLELNSSTVRQMVKERMNMIETADRLRSRQYERTFGR